MFHSVIFNPVYDYTLFDETVSYAAGDCVLYNDYNEVYANASAPEPLYFYGDGDFILFEDKVYQLDLSKSNIDSWMFMGPFDENLLKPYWKLYKGMKTLYIFTQYHAAGPWIWTDVELDTRHKNTWDEWGLIPIKHPAFAVPAVKIKTLSLPGGDGDLDLTEAIRGYPLYENRKGEFSFLCPKDHDHYLSIYNDIAAKYHGKRTQIALEDEPDWYCEGRVYIRKNELNEQRGLITIAYNLEPYKWSGKSVLEDWLWDTFSFEDGIITQEIFAEIELTGTTWETGTVLDFDARATGTAPVSPTFTASATAYIRAYMAATASARAISLTANTPAQMDGLVLYQGQWLCSGIPAVVKAYAASATTPATKLDIDFRQGRL